MPWVRRGGGLEGKTVVYDVLMLTTISAHKVGENLHHVGKEGSFASLPYLLNRST